ncbi:hypothetical protein SFC88_10295 [Nocardioides sp. HM23]|uniref:hypothetical protein n=1 Tax=Nocardioides bizhenqiangii TaxID=3095076 RepID=UPI002ACA31B0|nr:hypothetical protein [Nocardioides sp. HM23]MDZ5621219.1 hypothetical protein [Nocardioides sp. HM23]
MPNASHSGPRAPGIVLHIGAMKTGTTFLQQLLADHREVLAEHGYHVPREPALSLRGVLNGTPAADASTRRDRVAHQFLSGIREQDGRRSVVSWEFLSFLDQPRAARLVAALGAGGESVDVVLTVRDAARTIPAQWQTTCRNGNTVPWRRFVRDIGALLEDGSTTRSTRVFRRTQEIPRMLETWIGVVGRERVRVVTVPRAGGDPMLLWQRFAEASGIDPQVPVSPGMRRNPSLGHPSCELLRRVNVAFDGTLPAGVDKVIRAVVAPDLESRAGSEPAVRLDARGWEVAAAWNRLVRDAVTAAGTTVIGDLDDLPADPPVVAEDAEETRRPRPAEVLAAAATARTGLIDLGATPAAEPPEDVDTAVQELAAMLRELAGVDLTAARRARGRGRR